MKSLALPENSPLLIFLIFLRLGCISFGGPIAHLGYFRAEFVERRKWLSDAAYSDLLALSQFVPGPASSQTGFGLGLMRGGLSGGLAAWLGFTLPSAILMVLAAYGLSFARNAVVEGLIHGLKLLAVAIVAQAVLTMGRSLCPDRLRASLAFAVAALLIFAQNQLLQLGAIALGAAVGFAFLRPQGYTRAAASPVPVSRASAIFALIAFAALLVALPLVSQIARNGGLALASAFYQAGALVFGGGHVVLPLLDETVVKTGWVSRDNFLAGYGAAQALPGPLFTFSAFLGAKATIGPGGIAGAAIALISIFLPGLLILYGVLPYWNRLSANTSVGAALNGINAAVVGILGAALYQPIWTSAVFSPADASLALLAFAALEVARLPVLLVVCAMACAGAVLGTGL